METRFLAILVCVTVAFFGFNRPAEGAAAYPTKAINLAIAAAAGGSVDLTTRMLAKSATEHLGQTVIPENNMGGGGYVPMGKIFHEKPDGYNLGVFTFTLMGLNPLLTKAPFDATKFTPIMTYGAYTFLLEVRADSPWKTMKELVADMKKNPGKIKLATVRPLSLPNFAMFILKDLEKLDFGLVPFDGGPAAVASTLGGHTDGILDAGTGTAFVKEGKLRALANLGSERSPAFPDVPTLRELGYNVPGVQSTVAIYGPPGLPKDIVKKLDETFTRGMQSAEFVKVAKNFEFNTFYWNGDRTREYYEEMVPKLKAVLIKLGKYKE